MAHADNNTQKKPAGQFGFSDLLHYGAATAAILLCADMLTTNVLRFSGSQLLTRQLMEFGNLPANYQYVDADAVKKAAAALEAFTSGGVFVTQPAIIILLALNAAMIVFHFVSRRRVTHTAISAPTHDETQAQETRGAQTGNFGQLKAIVRNLKSMLTGASRQKPGSRLSTSTLERIVHLNLDIEAASKIVKSLEHNLAESATQLQVLAKAAMESGNRAVNSNIEWNKLTKMLEKQNHLHLSAQTSLKNIRRSVKEVFRLAQDGKQTEQGLVTRFRNIEANVREVFERSEDGDRLVQDMHSNINTCISDVRTASELVKQLSGKARDIVNIISVIDDIAEQTNLLALNASIEAARAGEQGQGFAVVADEVRKLAVRSSSTTRNITQLLQTIQAEAESACGFLSRGETSIAHTSSLFGRFDQHVALDRSSVSRCLEEISSNQILVRRMSDHLSELGKQCSSVDEFAGDLTKAQEGILSQNDGWQQEFRNSAIATDRIARNLTRNHFKLEHLERLAISNVETARDVHKLVSQNIGFSGMLRGSMTGGEIRTRELAGINDAAHFVDMLEETVVRMSQTQTTTKPRGKGNQAPSAEPVIGDMSVDVHPFDKAMFADSKDGTQKGLKGA